MERVPKIPTSENIRAKQWKLGVMGAAMLGLYSVSSLQAQVKPVYERILAHVDTSQRDQGDLQWPGAHVTFVGENRNGNRDFNWSSLIAPVQLEFPRAHDVTLETRNTIPYEYSRQFHQDDEAKQPLTPLDHQKLADHINQTLKKQLENNVIAFKPHENVHRLHHHEKPFGKITVKALRITGRASPEAQKEGTVSITPTHEEPENKKLAFVRAMTAATLTIGELEKLGVKDVLKTLTPQTATINPLTPDETQELAQSLGLTAKEWHEIAQKVTINTQEIQFTQQELQELARIAGQTTIDYPAILGLVADYNANRITDPKLLDQLDRLGGGKRQVEIDITYAGERKSTLIIPLPLTLLALIPLLRRRRGSARPLHVDRDVAPPPEQWDPHMEEEAIINDILRYYAYYEPLLRTCAREYYDLRTRDNRVATLTNHILADWSETDHKNHRSDSYQILWARVHAQALVDLEERRRQLPRRSRRHYPYHELLHQRVGELIERRMRRQGSSFRA